MERYPAPSIDPADRRIQANRVEHAACRDHTDCAGCAGDFFVSLFRHTRDGVLRFRRSTEPFHASLPTETGMKQAAISGAPAWGSPSQLCAEVARGELLRRWRVGVGVACALVLAAGVAVLAVLLNPPERVSLVTVGADYADNLSVPHNAHGWRGLKNLCEYAASSSNLMRGRPLLQAATTPIVADEDFTWSNAVDLLTGPGAVLVVSLHGGADEAGPYLRRETCSPSDEPTNRLRVADLLHELRKLPASLPKVVVFDATMSPGSRRYGEAVNEFSTGLRGLSNEIEAIPGLVVVSSSDEGEQSWRSMGNSATAFTEALLAALQGGAEDSDADGRLNVDEVLAEVAGRVSANAASLGRRQTLLRLPLGDSGRERSRRVEIAFASKDHALFPPVVWTPPVDELRNNWAGMSEVAANLPNPESNATVAWRRYRALLVRREQLIAVGAAEAAQRVADAIGDVEAILLEQTHAISSTDDPVEPVRPAAGDALFAIADGAFAELWPVTDANHHVVVARVLAATPAADLPVLRRLLFDRVVQAVSDEPLGRLQRGALLIDALRDPLAPLPADAHLISVLAEGLPDNLSVATWREALRLAIATRRLSISAFHPTRSSQPPYSAELLPWLRDRFAEADQKRLYGEDLLFVGETKLPAAIASLQEATRLYESLSDDAEIIRYALEARDASYDLLAFYTDAVEGLHATSPAIAVEIEELTEQTIDAHRTAGELSDTLLAVQIGEQDPAAAIQELPAKTARATAAINSLRDGIRHFRVQLLTRTGPTLELNREAVLLAPDVEIAERLRLLSSVPLASQSGVASRDNAQHEAYSEIWIEECNRRAQVALGVVGRRMYERAIEGRDAYQTAIDAIAHDAADEVVNRATIICAVLIAATQRNSQMLADITVDSGADEEYRRRIANVAAAVRRISDIAEPVRQRSFLDEVRRVGCYDYLIWKAERALGELWSDCQSGEEPHYQKQAMTYLEAADRLIPGRDSTDRLVAVANQPLVWRLDAPTTVDLVSSVAPAFALQVQFNGLATGHDFDGVATASVEAPAGYKIEGASTDGLMAVSMAPELAQSDAMVVVGLDAGIATVPPQGSLRLRGWFRGSRVETKVLLRNLATPTAEFVERPRRPGAGVAILDTRSDADIAAGGAVAIVLDASGSMGPGADANSKYRQATATLESLLRDMPAGVQVSVWVFGQAVGGDKTTSNPEATIARVLDPIHWDPTNSPLVDSVLDALAYPKVEPWNESPLARAVLMASRDLRGAAGYKSVIAITDGVDNRIAGDAYTNPQQKSLDVLMREELAGAGVSVQVIAFRVAAPEQADARKQFDFLTKLSPAGKWWEASEALELERVLRAAFEESQTAPLYVDNEPDGARLASVATIASGHRPSTWPSTPVSEGVYDLPRLAAKAKPQKALLSDGDLLLLATRQDADAVYLEPAAYTKIQAATQPPIETDGWRVAILSDRILPSGARSVLVAIEQHEPGSDLDPLLKVARPAEVWFESVGDPSQRLVWRRVDGYPAPCWEVEWPAGSATSKLAVWWASAIEPKMSVAIRPDALRQELVDYVGHSWQIDGAPVTLRRLTIETQRLPDARGELIDQPCLVVEMRGAIRCLTRLQGYPTAGQRQQWFDAAQASVATFWPVTAEALTGGIEGVELVAATSFKQEAESAGRSAVFKDGPAPTTEDYRPIPVVDWFNTAPAQRPASDARRTDRNAR